MTTITTITTNDHFSFLVTNYSLKKYLTHDL